MKKFENIILVTDMDGSLLNDKKEVSEKDKEMIKFFRENGGIFTIATGRIVESTRSYVEMLNIDFPVIVYNGGKIYDYKEEKTISEYCLEDFKKTIVEKVLKDKLNVGIEVYVDETIYIVKENDLCKRSAIVPCKKERNIPKDLIDKKWNKVLLSGDAEYLDKLQEDFLKYEIGEGTRSGKQFLEILPNGISKFRGIKDVMKLKEKGDYTIVSIGDDMNDKEMIEGADYGFVMENANKELLKIGKYFGTNNNNNPISYVIKELSKNLVLK